jgi:hypothetical protein
MRVTPAYADELVRGLVAAGPGPFERFRRRSRKPHDQAGPVDPPRHGMDATADRGCSPERVRRVAAPHQVSFQRPT